MRIVFAGNLMIRTLGGLGHNPDRKFFNGLIKSGHSVWEFSDRDIAHIDVPLSLKPLGRRLANRRFIETCENIQPDLIILALTDLLTNETVKLVRDMLPNAHIAHWNVDPLFSKSNVEKIRSRMTVCDSLFVTSSGPLLKELAQPGCFCAFIPNATDSGSELYDNSERTDFEHDLLYFGVGNPGDSRWKLVDSLREALRNERDATLPLRFSTFGSHGGPKLLGRNRNKVLEQTKMALNLNREEGVPLYSSDRISYLMPNGVVTFISAQSGLQRFFNEREAVFFDGPTDLLTQARALQEDDARRRSIARSGRSTYRRLFDSARLASYMIETALELPYSSDYEWASEVYKA